MHREQAVSHDTELPFTRAVAQSLLKLMAYKDEYEVARLYTDGEFLKSLNHQFEGEVQLEFYMAPPVLSKSKDGHAPRKVRLGSWMMPAMRLLAHGRKLRGTALDFFGRTQERRMERELIAQYRARIDAISSSLTPERMKVACDIAALPLAMRGFGHVKLANVALARAREAELLHRFDPQSYPRPPASREAGQIRGIRVTAAAQ
jgi:indolepyruvate ferredoxin oxidoreductase